MKQGLIVQLIFLGVLICGCKEDSPRQTLSSHPKPINEFIGQWESAFYNMAPATKLVVREDGTCSYQKKNGRWKINGDEIDLSEVLLGKLRLVQDGRMISDGIADGTSFVRWETLNIETKIEGLWSSDKSPKAGPNEKTMIFSDWRSGYRQGAKVGKYNVVRDHVEFQQLSGEIISIWPNADFSEFREDRENGFTLTRLPTMPVEQAILGQWTCMNGDLPANWHPLTFNSDRTFVYEGKTGTWQVLNGYVVLNNFQGLAQVQSFHVPENYGMRMTNKFENHPMLIRE